MVFFILKISSLLRRNNPMPSFNSQNLFLYHSTSNKVEELASLVENCKDIASLRKLHACVLTHGLCQSTFLGSKLVTCYPKFGFLAESRRIFDRIINNNLFLWNSVLVGYFRSGQYNEVLRLYLNLKQKKIGLNTSAVTFVLKSCVEMGNFEFGKGVHLDAFKFGLSKDGFVGSSLIGLYSKYEDMDGASKVFDEIAEKDVVVYTAMITGYAQVGGQLAYEAFEFACRMQEEEIDPNKVTMVSLLQAAAELEALKEGRSIHGYAIRRGIGCLDEVFETSLMDMYIKCRVPTMAACIFERMKIRTICSWNAMITGYLHMGLPLEALGHFCTMVQENVFPDLISLANGIFCCADLNYLREGKSIHGHIIRIGYQLDLVATTALVDMYSKCHNLIQARKLFDVMETRDVISYNVMIAGYIQNEFTSDALNIFTEMVGIGIKPNLGSILSVLSALSELKNVRGGRSVHGYILRHLFHMNTEVANQIVYMYARCGCIYDSRQVFDRIRYKDLISSTSMMMGYIYHGHADEAIILFWMMKKERLDHDSVTLISLLQAFSQLGHLSLAKEVHCHLYRALMERDTLLINSLITTYAKLGKLNMARNLFECTTRRCLTSWNTMIAAYGMHGNFIEVLRLFDRMKREMIKPNDITFTSILTACSHSGLVKEGLQVFNCMREEYCISPSEEHYACIVDLLGRAGRLEEAYDLLKLLPARQSAFAMGALLAACRTHGNTELGEVIGNCLLDLEPENASVYNSVSNLYAESGKWDEAARTRNMAKKKGLKKAAGYSLIELNQGALNYSKVKKQELRE
ncbi:pentatricopeptide repeat-containing protein At2g03380, mitochondrial-like [Durio zibethinus]|uniref:Pentatricopeptide repeat-containing protein At2g03380, mitochondrial-like n=1 Tax=Durio zibethinus TaxID=66656 RepID=A0A6P5YG68_DURZI|nr:pentatricopeptide repeat-containing protein At2g03380, mitochondrial-like [Durio zibethinus]